MGDGNSRDLRGVLEWFICAYNNQCTNRDDTQRAKRDDTFNAITSERIKLKFSDLEPDEKLRWIDGHLTIKGMEFVSRQWLDNLNIPFPLSFVDVDFKDLLCMRDVKSSFLSFRNSTFEDTIIADRINVDSTLQFWDCKMNAGVRVCGGKIHGNLDFTASHIQAGIFSDVDNAKKEKWFAVHAGGVDVRGNVLMTSVSRKDLPDHSGEDMTQRAIKLSEGRFCAEGTVIFLGAKIGRNFVLSGASLKGIQPSDTIQFENLISEKYIDQSLFALNAGSACIEGDLLLRVRGGHSFQCNGEMRLINATVKGDFECFGAKFNSPYYYAVTADGMEVHGSVYFCAKTEEKEWLECNGFIRFTHATLHEGIYLNGVKFVQDEEMGGEVKKSLEQDSGAGAIAYYKDKVPDFFKNEEKNINNQNCIRFFCGLDLQMATIGGKLSWKNGTICKATRMDLRGVKADILNIVKSENDEASKLKDSDPHTFIFDGGDDHVPNSEKPPKPVISEAPVIFESIGVFLIGLFLATILLIISFMVSGLVAEFITVIAGVVFLIGAALVLAPCVRFTDGGWRKSWPGGKDVQIEGLTYAAIEHIGVKQKRVDYIHWLSWSVSEVFVPQPFHQLERVLRGEGHARDACRVGMRREEKRRMAIDRKRLAGWVRYSLQTLLGVSIGYGYQLGRLFALIVALLFISTSVFSAACNGGEMAKLPAPGSNNHPSFNPFYYALDSIVPAVSLGQTQYWVPAPGAKNVNSSCKSEQNNAPLLGNIYAESNAPFEWMGGKLAEILAVWNPILGWIAVTLAVAGISGLVRSRD